MRARGYNRSQFAPFAQAIIGLCARNAEQAGIFNEENLPTRIRVEEVHRGFLVWWEGAALEINEPAYRYLQRLGRRSHVPVLLGSNPVNSVE